MLYRFLKPKSLNNIGTFQDGALCFPNPLRIALLETNFLWPEKGEPDFALSIGTGITSGTFGAIKVGPQSPNKLGSFSRIVRSWKRIFEPEVAWIDFLNQVPSISRNRYHRLNIQLEGPEIGINDISSIENLQKLTTNSILNSSQITLVKDSIYASMFYFELRELPNIINGAYECKGHIYCRMNLPKYGREYLWNELFKSGAFFLILGCPTPCVSKVLKTAPPFRREITFSVPSLDELLNISLTGLTSKPTSISGFPRQLKELINAQKLYTPFGRVDHMVQEKSLPLVPQKRGQNRMS